MANISDSLYLNTSRYVHGGVTEVADRRIEWWERTTYPSDVTDTVYVVENVYTGNPQAISTVFYGEPRYWWFICQYNKILDPVSEIVAGTTLMLPTMDRLALMLLGRVGGKSSARELVPTIQPVIV